jgi:hypothetical protein
MTGSPFRRWGLGLLIAVGTALTACESPVPPEYRGAPEAVSLATKPFPDFISSEQKAARCLYDDFLLDTDRTLTRPVAFLEDLSQYEWLSNEMKGAYLYMTPGMLTQMLRARDSFRTIMNVPPGLTVAQAIDHYAVRARTPGTSEGLHITDNRAALKDALTKAGFALKSYIERHPEDSRDSEVFIPEGYFVGPSRWKFC